MKVVVRYYSTLRGLACEVPETHQLESGTTVRDLLNQVFSKHPSLLPFQTSLLIARNNAYATPEAQLEDGDTVDLMPPVSGG